MTKNTLAKINAIALYNRHTMPTDDDWAVEDFMKMKKDMLVDMYTRAIPVLEKHFVLHSSTLDPHGRQIRKLALDDDTHVWVDDVITV